MRTCLTIYVVVFQGAHQPHPDFFEKKAVGYGTFTSTISLKLKVVGQATLFVLDLCFYIVDGILTPSKYPVQEHALLLCFAKPWCTTSVNGLSEARSGYRVSQDGDTDHANMLEQSERIQRMVHLI